MKLDVVTFGEVLWDIYETAPGKFERELGGAPANLAVTLARLGVRTAVVGGVGQDRFGADLKGALAASGVDTRFVLRVPNRTGLAFVGRDEVGEPTFLFYRHHTADMALTAADIVPQMGACTWALVGTSTLVDSKLAGAGLANATRRFLKVARAQGAHLVVDLNVRAHLWKSSKGMRAAIAGVLEHAMLVKASSADLAALGVGDEAKALAWVVARAKGATVLLTRGPGPASAVGAHGTVSVLPPAAKLVDATGAGDAFVAGVLAALLAVRAGPRSPTWKSAEMWTDALKIGSMLGSKAITKRGAVAGITGLARVHTTLYRLERRKN